MEPIFNVTDLVVRKGDDPLTFDIGEGLTLLITERESGSSTLCMTLAGRYKQFGGTIALSGTNTTPRQRFKRVAMAGLIMLDGLERQVDTRHILREQIAWSQPFFKLIPRDVLAHPNVEPWLEVLNLTDLDVSLDVGDLTVEDRFRLRVLLALVSRPDADALVIDDIDQIRSLRLRSVILDDLVELSKHLPVVVNSVNDDPGNHADAIVDLRHTVEASEPSEASKEEQVNA